MLHSTQSPPTRPIAPALDDQPRDVPIGLDGDYGDDGTQVLDHLLALWRQS